MITIKKGEPYETVRLLQSMVLQLQVAVAHGSGERKHVPDVAHAGEVHDAALKAQTVARVTGGAVLAQVKIEGIVLRPL